jgi:hypothetical protein
MGNRVKAHLVLIRSFLNEKLSDSHQWQHIMRGPIMGNPHFFDDNLKIKSFAK